MQSTQVMPSELPPNGRLTGHYCFQNRLYTVSYGAHQTVLKTPTYEEAPPVNVAKVVPNFSEPRYLSLRYPYMVFVPKYFPWRDELFKPLDYSFPNLPIEEDDEIPGRFRLRSDVAENCPWLFAGRFTFLRTFPTEASARSAAWCCKLNFLPLLAYVSMAFWIAEGLRAELLAGEFAVKPAFLDLLSATVVRNWTAERVGCLYQIGGPPGSESSEQRAGRNEVESLLSDIILAGCPFPLYISWGSLPATIYPGSVSEDLQRTRIAKENAAERQQRTQRQENAKKSGRPSKTACVYYWNDQGGHYIRNRANRAEFDDLWDDYPRPQRRFDPVHNEWDLCVLFEQNEPVFGKCGLPEDVEDGARANLCSRARSSGRGWQESDVPLKWRGYWQDGGASWQKCLDRVMHRFREAPVTDSETESTVYESIGQELFDVLEKRFGFVENRRRRTSVPSKLLAPHLLSTVIGVPDIGNELAAEDLSSRLSIFFGQLTDASVRMTGAQPYYVLRQRDGGIGSQVILFPQAADLLEVLRRGWSPDIRGCGQTSVGSRHQILARLDERRDRVLANYLPPRTRTAPQIDLTSGLGTVEQWRGSRGEQIPDVDFLQQFDDTVYDFGDCLWDGKSQHAYWHEFLTDHELDILCGVYHIGTGVYTSDGVDTQCEEWYQKRLEHFEKGVFLPTNTRKWRKNLRFNAAVLKCWKGSENVAAMIVEGLIARAAAAR
ncbi:hypothetical protein C8F04DRAFT_1182917 [Mycena alexandri]|uniref:Uncharacterized protein n=1 Tax=Mycena alexandri TaxID=1745969 RepID=A0AAD6SW35_9AGAR|nr:hypothetical protein C8F04DRAFT_1182917 [Mycena alexandri]